MTLSKAEWRAVRPDKLRNLDAAKLMEALRRKPEDSIGGWQAHLATCDELSRVLDRTPRMLLKTMTEAFRKALSVWHRDIEDIRKDGRAALQELGLRHMDEVCTRAGEALAGPARAAVEAAEARLAAERRRPQPERDPGAHDRLMTALRKHHEAIRVFRRARVKTLVREDRLSQDMLRRKEVRIGRFRMSCDGPLKDLQRRLSDLMRDHEKLMKPEKAPKVGDEGRSRKRGRARAEAVEAEA